MNTNDYVENKLQPPRAFFEWCYTSFRTYVWKNKNETIVASTRKHDWIIEKKLRKNSRLTFYDSSNCFQIVLSTSKRIEVQTYKVISEYENGVQCFREQLECIEIFSNNQHIKIGKICLPVYYGYNMGIALYPNEWKKRLERVSELKYLNLERLNVDNLATTYKYRTLIEFAQKINAHKLAYDVMSGAVDMRILTKNCLRKYKTFLKNTDNSLKEIQLKQTFESLNIPMVKGIEKYVLKSDISDFPNEIGAVKFQNWLVKQGKSFKYYQDYLNMLTLLKIEINKRNQLPPDLEVAHDCAVDRINQVNYEERDKEIKERLEQLRKYERDIDG
ncbi:TPA: PcfJ domain-containing protein, partial [Enterococcus faecalis]